jgi:hypothetical protein
VLSQLLDDDTDTEGGVMHRAILLIASVALAGCATRSVYLLADGRLPASDPVMNQQFETDSTVCQREVQKANSLSGNLREQNFADKVDQSCMAAKGYVSVPEEQVPAKQQELAAIAAEKARREAAAAPPPLPTHRLAAKKKQP